MSQSDEACYKDMMNYFIAPLCGLFLGMMAELIIRSISGFDSALWFQLINGVRLPFVGPLLGAVLLMRISIQYGQLKLTGWFKHLIIGGMIGLMVGYVIGVWILSPMFAAQHGIFAGKAQAAHARFFILIGMPVSGFIGCLCGIGYSLIQSKKKTSA